MKSEDAGFSSGRNDALSAYMTKCTSLDRTDRKVLFAVPMENG